MTTLLIVDDESIIRRGIHFHIDWTANNIDVVGEAVNGEDGLQKAIKYQPDIILTDIRMPKMNGLQMTTKIKALLPKTQIILISGVDDKEYLLGAIKNGVQDYVMKSANSDDILQAVLRCREKLHAETPSKTDSGNSSLMDYCLHNFRLNFIDDVISGKTDSDILQEQAALLEIDLSGPYYISFILSTDGAVNIDSTIMSLLFYFSKYSPFLTFKESIGILGILNTESRVISDSLFQSAVSEINKQAYNNQFLIPRQAIDFEELSFNFHQLLLLIERLCWHRNESVIVSDDMQQEPVDCSLLLMLEQEIIKSFTQNNYLDVVGKLDRYHSMRLPATAVSPLLISVKFLNITLMSA